MSKKILVTGGAGYIGSQTCKVLKQQGYEPVVFDNLVYGYKDFVQWGDFEQGDLLDVKRLHDVFVQHTPCAVVHFAAYAYVGESVQDPGKYYTNNVIGSLNLLNAMKTHGVKNIVFSSTCATYGIPTQIPISETHAQNPINPYGNTKLVMEKMLHDFDVAHGIKSVPLRYFNAAGADPEGDVGEAHDPETHLIPLVLEVAAGKREYISVFGTDYNTSDGTCIRDYIHIHDLATAHVLALQYLEKTQRSEAFNLGNGTGFSVYEVIAAAETVTGKKIPIKNVSRRAGDPDVLVGTAEKAREFLGWKPEYYQLETIIAHAWHWYQKRFLLGTASTSVPREHTRSS